MKRYQMYIGGEWRDSAGGEFFDTQNPYTGKTWAQVARGTPDDVAHMNVYVKTPEARPAVNKEWVAMFPDEESRPTRHTIQNDHLAGAIHAPEHLHVGVDVGLRLDQDHTRARSERASFFLTLTLLSGTEASG